MSVVTATIISEGNTLEPHVEVLAIDITKEVNRIPRAQLLLLDGDEAQRTFPISDTAFFEPGNEIEIKLRYEGTSGVDTTVFKGLVVKHGVEIDDQGTVLTIELKDAALKLNQARKSAVYRKQTDDKIIADLIRAQQLSQGPKVATQPQHAEIVQYYCTDWDFILSRAESHGLLVVANDGEVSVKKIELSGAASHTFEYGISEIFNFVIEVDASHQYDKMESIAWDVKTQKLTKASEAKAFDLAQGNLNASAVAKKLGAETYTLTDPVPLHAQEVQAWADARMAHSRMTMLRGRLSVPGFADVKLMDVMEIVAVGSRFNGKTLITGIRHRVTGQGWLTDVQFGLPPERFAERQDIADAPAGGLLPAVHGLQIGIVDAFEADPDKLHRVKVVLPGVDEKQGAVWARLASLDAGKARGVVFRPEPGDEVVVGFFNDDPRQAVILGSMYSGKNAPPERVGQPEKKNLKKAIVTKKGTTIGFIDDDNASVFIETPEANKIMLDDDAQTIEISDQHGNKITMGKDGIEIVSAKDVKIDASDNIEIKGTKVDVK